MARRENAASLKTLSRLLAAGAMALWCSVRVQAAEANVQFGQFTSEQLEFYQQQVLPVLTENCYKCHSHEADKIKGGFVLDSREGLLKGGETGPAIIPGDSDKSLLMK